MPVNAFNRSSTPPMRRTNPSEHGRIDHNRTVWLHTSDGDIVVGSWAVGSTADGLAYFGRKYDDILLDLDLAAHRLREGRGVDTAEQAVNLARERIRWPDFLGDINELKRTCDEVDLLLQAERTRRLGPQTIATGEELPRIDGFGFSAPNPQDDTSTWAAWSTNEPGLLRTFATKEEAQTWAETTRSNLANGEIPRHILHVTDTDRDAVRWMLNHVDPDMTGVIEKTKDPRQETGLGPLYLSRHGVYTQRFIPEYGHHVTDPVSYNAGIMLSLEVARELVDAYREATNGSSTPMSFLEYVDHGIDNEAKPALTQTLSDLAAYVKSIPIDNEAKEALDDAEYTASTLLNLTEDQEEELNSYLNDLRRHATTTTQQCINYQTRAQTSRATLRARLAHTAHKSIQRVQSATNDRAIQEIGQLVRRVGATSTPEYGNSH